MKKIIFLGGIWTSRDEDWILANSKGAVQSAANNFQLSIIDGIDKCTSEPTTIVSSFFIGSFPKKFKKMIIKDKSFNHSIHVTHKDYCVGFVNLPIIKNRSRIHNIKKTLKRIINKNDEYFVLGYSMTYTILKSLLFAKRIGSYVKTCLFVPDLPEYMNLNNSNTLPRFFECVLKKELYRDIKKVDSFVVLTEHMYGRLNVNKPHIVVEGMLSSEITLFESDDYDDKYNDIVYTGSLNFKYGIKELIDALNYIPDTNIRLVICGSGQAEGYIKEKAKTDSRIVFFGALSHEDCTRIQKQGKILINPRSSKEEYTLYSFPSKTIEYMASGVPVLMSKLPGMPDEYFPYIYVIDDESSCGIASAIKRVLSIPLNERRAKGQAAREFVIREKNNIAQSKKIINFLNDNFS